MKRSTLRYICLLVALALTLPVLSSCAGIGEITGDSGTDTSVNIPHIDPLDLVSTKTAPAAVIPNYTGSDTLRVAVNDKVSVPSPLFADGDQVAENLSFVKLVGTDRNGKVIYNAINGQSFEYASTDYTYYGMSDVSVNRNVDGTVNYDIKLREDAFFSDGVNITADDVIFTMYVLLDNTYDGYSDFGRLNIVGLDRYRAGMSCLADIIYDAAGTKLLPDGVSEMDRQRFLDKLSAAKDKYIKELVGYVSDNYHDERSRYLYGGKWAEQLTNSFGRLDVAYSMVIFGYAEWEKNEQGEYTGALVTIDGDRYDCYEQFPDADVLFPSIAEESGGIVALAQKQEYGIDFTSILKDTFGSSYEYYFGVEYAGSESVGEVSGIKKTGTYSLSVTVDGYSYEDIYAFSFYIAPLHVYGSREQYKYTQSRFGFAKGDLRELRNKESVVCSGAYVYKNERDGAVVFERNKLYYLGCPYISYIELVEVSEEADAAHDIAEGRYDVASAELDGVMLSSLRSLNGSTELEGGVVSFASRLNDKYSYIGFNCARVSVTQDGMDAQSVALRRAIGTLLSYYTPSSVAGVLGEVAGDVYYPMALCEVDDTHASLFNKDAQGNDIYTPNMNKDAQRSAASAAALGYLVDAGYTLDRRGKKVQTAPEGAKLEYDFWICTETDVGSAISSAVKDTAQALTKIGIILNIIEVGSESEFEQAISEGRCDMWAYGYDIGSEPDIKAMYHTDSMPKADAAGRNYMSITDSRIDAMIADMHLSESTDVRYSKYTECFDTVYSLCAEIPLYAVDRVLFVSSERIAKDSVLSDLTGYFGWIDTVAQLKLN